jgi:hypothetical protein
VGVDGCQELGAIPATRDFTMETALFGLLNLDIWESVIRHGIRVIDNALGRTR